MNNLNKYVLEIPNKNEIILFNTFNESIVVLNSLQVNKNHVCNLKPDEMKYLKENNFLTSSKKLYNLMMKRRKIIPETISITISLTQRCNLRCPYCSQNNCKDSLLISKDVLDQTIEYIINRVKKNKYKYIAINFFGGEPLLAKKEIIYFKENLEKHFLPENISYSIVTNGVLLDLSFLNNFDNINVKITLSEKLSHDKYRVFPNKKGSYDLIYKNLKNVSNYFVKHKKSNLTLRYNVDNLDNKFSSFIQTIKADFPFINYIDIAPVFDFEFNKNLTTYTKSQFTDWYLKSLETLLKEGFLVEFPTSKSTSCKAYSKDSLKIFPDGKVNLCNGCDCNYRKSHISSFSHKTKKSKIFKKDLNKELPLKCRNCNQLFLCGGVKPCKNNQCDYLIYDLDKFIKFYIHTIYKNSNYTNLFLTSEYYD